MAFSDVEARCKATTKNGTPCGNPALLGQDYCRVHTEQMGVVRVKKSWRDDDLVLKLTDESENQLFSFALDAIERDFDLNESSDRMQAQMSAFYFVKWRGAAVNGEKDLQVLYDDLMRKNLGCLKATREKREGLEIKITTPAEWAANLLAEMAGDKTDDGHDANQDEEVDNPG